MYISHNMDQQYISMHKQNFIKISSLFLKILKKKLTSIKGHNSVERLQHIICNCPYLHFVSINAFTKFYQNQSIDQQGSEHKRNFDINQGP